MAASRPQDGLTGMADLAPQLVEEVVLTTVRDTHRAIARRTFGLVPGARVPKMVHDGMSEMVYGILTVVTRGTRVIAGGLSRLTAGRRDPAAVERNARWRRSVSILNGILGDLLEEQDSPLALNMTVRVDAADVVVARSALAGAHPDATGRVAVLLHGLVEDEESWDLRREEHGGTYADVLRAAGVTPVMVRYNSGRHISSNAVDLDTLLQDLVEGWPVEVTELILIGHSMGGLVIRGAGALAAGGDHSWPGLTTHLVTLGTPHGGAPLEKAANAAAWALTSVPEMAAFGGILRRRSAGIKDLRHGYLLEADWFGGDPDGRRSKRGAHVERIGEATHHVVGATLGATHGHLASHTLGDLMVRWGSAVALGNIWAEEATVTHLGSTNHFALLNHPEVSAMLTRLLAAPD